MAASFGTLWSKWVDTYTSNEQFMFAKEVSGSDKLFLFVDCIGKLFSTDALQVRCLSWASLFQLSYLCQF